MFSDVLEGMVLLEILFPLLFPLLILFFFFCSLRYRNVLFSTCCIDVHLHLSYVSGVPLKKEDRGTDEVLIGEARDYLWHYRSSGEWWIG